MKSGNSAGFVTHPNKYPVQQYGRYHDSDETRAQIEAAGSCFASDAAHVGNSFGTNRELVAAASE